MNESIVNYAFQQAISNSNIQIIKQCLIAGVSLDNIPVCWISDSYYDYDYEETNPDTSTIFKMLLDYDAPTLFKHTKFMIRCINVKNDYCIRKLIDAGYNCDCPNALEIFESVHYLTWDSFCLLIDNGFGKYSKQLAMVSIKSNQLPILKILINRGTGIYSLLDRFCNWVRTNVCSWLHTPYLEIIFFGLDNIYQLKSDDVPVQKYLLLRSNDILPLEISITIMTFYMGSDFINTYGIRDYLHRNKL